jgi:HAD superfamily hydrolase (TIGR01549 family)
VSIDDFDWIFFDCFNTLIDDFDEGGDESGLGSLPVLAVELGLFARPADFVAAYHVARAHSGDGREITLPERLARVLAAAPRPPLPAENARVRATLLARWEEDYLRLIRPTPGVREMLEHWSPLKPAAVVSNFFLPHHPEHYLRRFGLEAHFRFVVDSAQFGYRKPDPRIFLHAIERAGLTPADAPRILFVGDRNDLDILPARQLGLRVLHFNRSRSRPVEPVAADVPAVHDWADFRSSLLGKESTNPARADPPSANAP